MRSASDKHLLGAAHLQAMPLDPSGNAPAPVKLLVVCWNA